MYKPLALVSCLMVLAPAMAVAQVEGRALPGNTGGAGNATYNSNADNYVGGPEANTGNTTANPSHEMDSSDDPYHNHNYNNTSYGGGHPGASDSTKGEGSGISGTTMGGPARR